MIMAIVLGLSQAAAPATELRTDALGQVVMSRAEIRAYNAALPRDHPAYIRCTRTLDIGSLVKKTSSCRTNAAWQRTEQTANDDVRYTMDKIMTSQSTFGN